MAKIIAEGKARPGNAFDRFLIVNPDVVRKISAAASQLSGCSTKVERQIVFSGIAEFGPDGQRRAERIARTLTSI